MEREILFRGKRVDNGQWVYGNLSRYIDGRCEIRHWYDLDDVTPFKIIPCTVGQFIGLRDKNGKKIFEGDVYASPHCEFAMYQVKFFNGAFCGGTEHNGYSPINFIIDNTINEIESDDFSSTIEIIGNIHEQQTKPNK